MIKCKQLLSIIFILIITLLLASCGEPDDPPIGPPGDTAEPCDVHTDKGGDGVCDVCGEKIPKQEEEVEIPKNLSFSGVTFPNKTFTYDGKKHSIEIVGRPNNTLVTVEYSGNEKIGAGTYTVTAKFYYKDKYIEGKDMSATMTIERAYYDMYGVSLNDKVVIKDGNTHSIAVSGTLPKGVKVTYSTSGASAVGSYPVIATFKGDSQNYHPIDSMRATLTIKNGPKGLEGVSMSGDTVIYNGSYHSIKHGGTLGEGITLVGYEGNSNKDSGEYTVTAKFAENGVYNPQLNLTATLTIKPRKLYPIAENLTAEYDGDVHKITLKWKGSSLAPKGVTVTEIGNGVRAIGENKVIFRFSVDEENKKNILYHPDLVATITITPPEEEMTEGLQLVIGNSGNFVVSGYTGTSTSVIIPATYTTEGGRVAPVDAIKSEAFAGNTTIKYVYMPPSVVNIGNSAFRGCTSLEEVTFGEVTNIGALAFDGTALKNVTLPDTLSFIAQGAFRNTPMVSITLPFIGGSKYTTSNPYLGYIFGASLYGGNRQYVPATLTDVTLSGKCVEVPEYAFYGCDSIERITLGSSVKHIGVSAFAGCISLSGIYIPKSVSSIPAAASATVSPFFGCSDSLVIGIEAAEENEAWGSYWCSNGAVTLEKMIKAKYAEFEARAYGW